MAEVSINSDLGEWGSSSDSGERARLLQSPCVDTAPKSEGEASPEGPGRGTTSTIGAIFIVVNACLGAGLLNFPAAFSTAGGLAAGVTLQMVSVLAARAEMHFGCWVWALPPEERFCIRGSQCMTHAATLPTLTLGRHY